MTADSAARRPAMPAPGRRRRAEMLRVDHAGEYGAVAIYRGQAAVLSGSAKTAPAARLVREMEAGESEHLSTFDALLRAEHIRPTVLAPIWQVAGFGLGAVTALMGEKAAMACTTAVETVIAGHYADQVQELGTEAPALAATLARFRDEEIGHHDTALANGARDLPFYDLFAGAIGAGCRLAIRLSEKF